ncbi:hypothetical protein EVAR_20915_1 [Eumeta japonica]|uniref:Uncharacterized protein n=1 Tax=Eumeta variegata TaxID=151549 RepID=A0A4C1UWU7_EUMVA|nr:hypothetical protein EVAR_20915_1 [Eumeta japonica]
MQRLPYGQPPRRRGASGAYAFHRFAHAPCHAPPLPSNDKRIEKQTRTGPGAGVMGRDPLRLHLCLAIVIELDSVLYVPRLGSSECTPRCAEGAMGRRVSRAREVAAAASEASHRARLIYMHALKKNKK